MIDLRGKGLVLTGASGGIGEALTFELLGAGARVLAVGRSVEALAAQRARLPSELRARFVALGADITDPAGIDAVHSAAENGFAPISLLVHAAGIEGAGMFGQASAKRLRDIFETNLLAPVLLTHRLLPLLSRQPDACVTAIGSTFASIGFPGFAAYSASKFGLRGFMEAMAREAGIDGVRYLHVSPRATRTAFNSARIDALNAELKTPVDAPAVVARRIVQAIRRGQRRVQIGWPENLFIRINGALPGLVDRALAKKIAVVRHHLDASASTHVAEEKIA